MPTRKFPDSDPDGHVISSYGDGLLWHRTHPIARPESYGPTHAAVLKKPHFRHAHALPVTMAVKSAFSPADVALLKKELSLFGTLSEGCPFVCRPLGQEITFGLGSVAVHNILIEYSYRNLRVLLRGPHRLVESVVRRITRDILEGVCCLHRRGYVHCGLTPDVLLVFENGGRVTVKIGDLSLVKRADEKKKRRKGRLSGDLRRNLRYLAPEVVGERVQEEPADVWAVGCVVMEMLTWRSMWEGKGDKEVEECLSRVGRGREVVRVPSEGVSEEAIGFLMECLDRKASRRSTAMMLLEHPFVASDGGD